MLLTLLLQFAVAQNCGKIDSYKGEVHLLKYKAEKVNQAILVKKTPLEVGCKDGLRTGPSSRVKLSMSTAKLSLGPNTQIHISKFAERMKMPKEMSLYYGKVRSHVQKKKELDYKIKTPAATIGIRGTDFYVEYNPQTKESVQATLEGKTVVEQKGTKQQVEVPSGMQVKVKQVAQNVPQETPSQEIVKPKKIAKSLPEKILKEEPEVFVEPEVVESLVLTPIQKEEVEKIQSTSVLVKNDKEFQSSKAIEIIGTPEEWKPMKDEIPLDFQDIENVF